MASEKVCPDCGRINDVAARFCGNCGTPLRRPRPLAPEPPPGLPEEIEMRPRAIPPSKLEAHTQPTSQVQACPTCNYPAATEDIFCRQCGARLIERPALCPRCGDPIEANEKFCNRCGLSLG